MSETIKVRFGMLSSRELEIDAAADSDIGGEFERALEAGQTMYWVSDASGHHHGVVVAHVAFVEIEAARPRGIGFGSSE